MNVLAGTFWQRIGAWIAPFREPDGPPPARILPFFRWSLAGTGFALAIGALAAAAAGSAEVISAMLLGLVIDMAEAAGPAKLFTGHGWAFAGIAFFLVVLRPLAFGANAALQSVVLTPNLSVLVLSRLHRWTMGQSITYFDNDFAGRIAQKQMQTSRALTDITVELLNTVVFALTSIVATLFLVVAIDWRIGALLLIWLGGYLFYIRSAMPAIRVHSMGRAAARANVTGQVVDTITNMRTVKLFAHHDYEDQAAIGAMQTYRDRTLVFGSVSTAFRFWLMVIAGVLPVLMVGMAVWLWTRGVASSGDIAATGTVALRIAQMTGWVSFSLMTMYANLGEVEDGMRTLTPAHALTDAPDAIHLPTAGEVVFDDVSFGYGRAHAGLQRASLSIRKGEKIGLVGASGAGKSTLVALLLRLYDAETGRVLVGGHDVRQVTQESLRRQIAMVTQDTAMFNRSARENIRYGRPDASDAEVEEAARKAEAHDFILGLQDHKGRRGYDAQLGERGVKLSGGQRQRLALARAILKDAPILVLDEATSALDSEVEAQVQAALEVAMRGKTVIAIAHRLSTIASMDRIVVMDHGRIIEEGTHDSLLARGGLYARYWRRQSGGFLATEDAAANGDREAQ
ncbi:MAG: ABC transporter ATP-binding protein [Rubellimicrobium sp.]|nr:ABC transporter ATP-binding protein [Rubellimicrobium sp.]